MRVFRQVVSRELPVDVPTAYAWLTDYQADDLALLGTPEGKRSVERINDRQVRVVNPRPFHPSIIEDTLITLRPPDRWDGTGELRSRGRRAGTYTLRYELAAAPLGSRVTMTLEVFPSSFLYRLAIGLLWRRFRAEHEGNYDDIVRGLAAGVADGSLPAPGSREGETSTGSRGAMGGRLPGDPSAGTS